MLVTILRHADKAAIEAVKEAGFRLDYDIYVGSSDVLVLPECERTSHVRSDEVGLDSFDRDAHITCSNINITIQA